MSVQFIMPNGEVVPVPQDVVAEGNKAQQGFYDGQYARLVAEGAIPTPEASAPAAPVEE